MMRMSLLVPAAALVLGAPSAQAAYQASPEQLSSAESRLREYGKTFPLGFMLQIGKPYEAGRAAYFYKFGDDTIHWRLEEWEKLPDGSWHVFLWRFYPTYATRGDYHIRGGMVDMREYEEPMNIASGEVIHKSELSWHMILQGTPNRDPFPEVDHR